MTHICYIMCSNCSLETVLDTDNFSAEFNGCLLQSSTNSCVVNWGLVWKMAEMLECSKTNVDTRTCVLKGRKCLHKRSI